MGSSEPPRWPRAVASRLATTARCADEAKISLPLGSKPPPGPSCQVTRRGTQRSRPCQPPEWSVAARAWAWQPLATLRASLAGELAIGGAPLRTVHEATIAARVVHTVAQPLLPVGQPRQRARAASGQLPYGVPGTPAPPPDDRGMGTARQPASVAHDAAQRAELGGPPRGPRHAAVRADPAPGALQLVGGQGPVAVTAVAYPAISADAGRTTRLRATARPTRPARTTVTPEPSSRHPEAAKTPAAPNTQIRTSTNRTPEPVHTFVSADTAVSPPPGGASRHPSPGQPASTSYLLPPRGSSGCLSRSWHLVVITDREGPGPTSAQSPTPACTRRSPQRPGSTRGAIHSGVSAGRMT